jgi:hypothetical protein
MRLSRPRLSLQPSLAFGLTPTVPQLGTTLPTIAITHLIKRPISIATVKYNKTLFYLFFNNNILVISNFLWIFTVDNQK